MNPKAQFTPLDVAEIRLQYARGTLNVRAWADARGCSIETVRRVARGDTYRQVGGQTAHHAWGGLTGAVSQGLAVGQQGSRAPTVPLGPTQPIPVGEILADEPTDEDAAASFARLQAALAAPTADEARRDLANALVDELRGKAEPPTAKDGRTRTNPPDESPADAPELG